jgi:hypothetical protein
MELDVTILHDGGPALLPERISIHILRFAEDLFEHLPLGTKRDCPETPELNEVPQRNDRHHDSTTEQSEGGWSSATERADRMLS